MSRRFWVFILVVGLGACGPREAGPKEREILFWRVTESKVSFNQCTDDVAFRDQLQALEFDENTYVVYRVEKGAQKATLLSCETFDLYTCTESPAGVVFDVAGNELFFVEETTSPLGASQCDLRAIQNWVLIDRGEALTMEISNVLSLSGDSKQCQQVEQQIQAQSPNKLGVSGCVVNFEVQATLD